jgi:hypothetical protein
LENSYDHDRWTPVQPPGPLRYSWRMEITSTWRLLLGKNYYENESYEDILLVDSKTCYKFETLLIVY